MHVTLSVQRVGQGYRGCKWKCLSVIRESPHSLLLAVCSRFCSGFSGGFASGELGRFDGGVLNVIGSLGSFSLDL